MHKYLPKLFIFLDQYNSLIFKYNITNLGVIYRNYKSSKKEVELIKIAKACRKKRYQLFVSNNVKLALKVKAEGIYIPSFNKNSHFLNLENKKITILGSAHNQSEINNKINQKCEAIFLSPVFNVKKSKYFLGVHKFNFLTHGKKVNFFALGGISEQNRNKLKLVNAAGLGGISLFKKKPAYKRPVF